MSDGGPGIDERRARELLEQQRRRIEASLAELERVRGSELDEIDTATNPIDEGGQIEEEEIDDAIVAQLRAELEAIERAEQRLADGTYGVSVESGEPIPAERLEAIPWAERTAAEQERYERTHPRP